MIIFTTFAVYYGAVHSIIVLLLVIVDTDVKKDTEVVRFFYKNIMTNITHDVGFHLLSRKQFG